MIHFILCSDESIKLRVTRITEHEIVKKILIIQMNYPIQIQNNLFNLVCRYYFVKYQIECNLINHCDIKLLELF